MNSGVVALNLNAMTKKGIIEELIDLMLSHRLITDREDALQAVMEREKRMSTGLQHGVAMPHGRSDKIAKLVTAIGIKREGVEFESLDGEPARIFVLSLSPASGTALQCRFLSKMGELLNSPSIREKLLDVTTRDEIIRILTG
ncbi:MAG: PTS sugar transporter subunit IIA [Kiritimatiellae bacterium]|nr:PTS sugar transporter subunit IIA [Kiritimatiellia bacterium]